MRIVLACVVASTLGMGCAGEVPDPDRETGTIYWETLSPTDEAGSTHLWIVDRAVDILGKHGSLTKAANAYALMTDATCRGRWQQGLIDADYKAAYNGGLFDIYPGASDALVIASGATWASHFYDPDTRKNYLGQSKPTARGEALAHLANAKSFLKAKNKNAGCYELGLALHYMTDMTQPMHAALFTATDSPVKLHSHLETYAMSVQAPYALADWAATPSGTTASVLDATAVTSKSLWAPMWSAVSASYGSRCTWIYLHVTDDQSCWEGDAGVNEAIGDALVAAQEATAEFLYVADLK